jgi:AGZA family xanthine/uracil permease-like MFS transporter
MESTKKSNPKYDLLERIFKIQERGSTVRTEIIGGATTFLTMAYIVFVNPAILSATGMDKGALITATILASAIGTMISAFWANAPFALAPGMGLNAFFTYALVIGRGVPWQDALGVVFLSGVVFLILAIGGLRQKIADAIPTFLVTAATAGIGLFLAFIGLKSMEIVVANPATFVSIGKFTTTSVLGVFALVLMGVLEHKRVRGGILISIAITTVIGLILGLVSIPDSLISLPPSIKPVAFKLNILGALKFALIGPIFSFMFVDLFDSLGLLMACCKEMGMVDKDGKAKGLGRMLHTDVCATIIGALLGTSTVTTLTESAAGIAAGARTGLAALVTSVLFLLTLLFTPIVGMVPTFAAAPAMILVGVFMFKSIGDIDFTDMKTALPAFVTVLMMPLTYSISTGLSLGFLTYIALHVGTGDFKAITKTLWFIGALSLLSLII